MNKKKSEFLASAQNYTEKITAGLISFIVIAILLISGPVYALSLILGAPSSSSPTIGDTISFTASMNITNNDAYVPIENFTLTIAGTSTKTCVFNVSGANLTACEGMTINRTSSPSTINYSYGYGQDTDENSFGYGYGYSYVPSITNLFVYNVTLDTTNYGAGSYVIAFTAKAGSTTYSASNKTITINSPPASSGGGGTIGSTVIMPNATEVVTLYTADIPALSSEAGYTQELIEGDKIIFYIPLLSGATELHFLTIDQITLNSATITIRSSPITITLQTGESKVLNLTSKDYYDVYVELESVKDGKAKLIIKSINEKIEPKRALFDVKVDILPSASSKYKSPTGMALLDSDKLSSKVSLLNIGAPGRLNVTITYIIKDSSGKIVYEETETIETEAQNEFIKEFDISKFGNGNYKLITSIKYDGQTEPAESEEVFAIDKPQIGTIIMVIFLILIVIALILIFIWPKLKKKRKKSSLKKKSKEYDF